MVERDRRPLAVLVPFEDAMRLRESPADARARAVAAIDRLEAFAQRMRMDEAAPKASPDAASLMRQERTAGHGDAG